MRIGKKDLAAGVVFVALIVGFVVLLNFLMSTSDKQETQLVEDAVKNAALTCYAVEGTYPESLDYLREHYKLAYNMERFVVEYDAFASNLMPTITVRERGVKDI
ncbi:MAG: hypothetical protein IJ188_10180 [Clostridia bacterium]|nr:hypothetical protein [Clostridia bacterium]